MIDEFVTLFLCVYVCFCVYAVRCAPCAVASVRARRVLLAAVCHTSAINPYVCVSGLFMTQ
jgi:hypothetical protein